MADNLPDDGPEMKDMRSEAAQKGPAKTAFESAEGPKVSIPSADEVFRRLSVAAMNAKAAVSAAVDEERAMEDVDLLYRSEISSQADDDEDLVPPERRRFRQAFETSAPPGWLPAKPKENGKSIEALELTASRVTTLLLVAAVICCLIISTAY